MRKTPAATFKVAGDMSTRACRYICDKSLRVKQPEDVDERTAQSPDDVDERTAEDNTRSRATIVIIHARRDVESMSTYRTISVVQDY